MLGSQQLGSAIGEGRIGKGFKYNKEPSSGGWECSCQCFRLQNDWWKIATAPSIAMNASDYQSGM
jgi:hypothetical protein